MLIRSILLDRRVVFLLFVINLLGTAYGFYWYKSQLSVTPPIFLAFVPDSPTASMFFTIFLFFLLIRRSVPYIEALAVMTLFKYGIWAVAMNLLTLYVDQTLSWQGYMLIASHGAMAIEGLLFASVYQMKLRHLAVAAVWTLHNDVIDYVFGMMPVYSSLNIYMKEIGYFTFWLSILSIYITFRIAGKKRALTD